MPKDINKAIQSLTMELQNLGAELDTLNKQGVQLDEQKSKVMTRIVETRGGIAALKDLLPKEGN